MVLRTSTSLPRGCWDYDGNLSRYKPALCHLQHGHVMHGARSTEHGAWSIYFPSGFIFSPWGSSRLCDFPVGLCTSSNIISDRPLTIRRDQKVLYSEVIDILLPKLGLLLYLAATGKVRMKHTCCPDPLTLRPVYSICSLHI